MTKTSLVFCFLCCCFYGFSQLNENLWFHELGRDQGLTAHDYNFFIYRDSLDYVWISSVNGLQRFDGQEVKLYSSDPDDSTSLLGNNIQSNFFEDDRHNLWFCTYNAIHFYDRAEDHFRRYTVPDSIGQPVVADYQIFHLEQNRYLWFRAGKQIYRVDVSEPDRTATRMEQARVVCRKEHYHWSVGLSTTGAVKYLFGFSDKKRPGLDFMKIKNGQVTQEEARFLKKNYSSIFQVRYEHDESVWLSTKDGMLHWNMLSDKIREFAFEVPSFSYFVPQGDSVFIISSHDHGLFKFNRLNGQFKSCNLRSVADPTRAGVKTIRNIYLDRDEVLWVTAMYEGVFYMQLGKQKFRNIFVKDEELKCFGFTEFDREQVLVVARHQLYLQDRSGQKEAAILIKDIPYINCFHRKEDSDILWIGTIKGLFAYHLRTNKMELVTGSEAMDILAVYVLSDGTVLMSAYSNPLREVEQKGNDWQLSDRTISKLGEVNYTLIYQDQLKRVWAYRNESSIDIFDWKNEQLDFIKEIVFRGGSINGFYENKKRKTIYMATYTGLVKMDVNRMDASLETLTRAEGLADNVVKSILPGTEDDFWLSTKSGLCLYESEKNNFRHFSMAEGMQSLKFDSPAAIKLKDGSLWWGGEYGITILPADTTTFSNVPPEILIRAIKIKDEVPDSIVCQKTGSKALNEIEELVYSYKENTISFDFIARDFSDPHQIRLRCKMEGTDTDWVEIENGAVAQVRYPNLPNGQNHFVIEAYNLSGDANARSSRQISIYIKPPFWKTWWFKILAALAVLWLIRLVVQYRIGQVREKEELKTRIAENKMSTLIAQLSPHFIFNSLQSVNWFILKENKAKASEYLGRFSGLIRMMLENSRSTHHLIEEEVKFLNLYMKVEAQRFKIPFHYEVIVDKEVDIYNTEIPTMMLQPFIENSIWHGLSNREEEGGRIRIEINQEKGLLYCIVEDNGVGRKKAAEIANKKGKEHQSRALQILDERLQLLFPQDQDKCSIIYTDLYDEQGRACGTRIAVSLPLM